MTSKLQASVSAAQLDDGMDRGAVFSTVGASWIGFVDSGHKVITHKQPNAKEF